ncbi:probable E3 ubiquitin-protein ligase MID2 [Mytilus trossulus]|uniref:probable E3 ubiquitin-protein ligase MID2 n=1 Tax=Mytilus trossulus TaxID=6551 RepID=UPI0030067EF4
MASSGSGQIPINCQFCETEKVIKWKCIDCELLICDKCKDKIHLKIKGGKDHKILDIKEIGSETEELCYANLKCQDHSGQNYCLYCKTCESLVCPVCIAKVHKKQHDLVEITEEYNLRIDILKKCQSKMINDKSKLETEKVRLKQIQTTGHANFVKVKENILFQENALIDTIRNYAGRFTEELDKQLKTMYSSTDGEINSVSIGMAKIDYKSKDLKNLITMTDVAEFFRQVDRIEKSMNITLPKSTASLSLSLPQFVKGEITQINFGTLVHDKNSEDDSNVTITIDTEINSLSRWLNFSRSKKYIKKS